MATHSYMAAFGEAASARSFCKIKLFILAHMKLLLSNCTIVAAHAVANRPRVFLQTRMAAAHVHAHVLQVAFIKQRKFNGRSETFSWLGSQSTWFSGEAVTVAHVWLPSCFDHTDIRLTDKL